MSEVTIYADCELQSAVDDGLLLRINDSWNKDDESFCSGRGSGDHALALNFEMEGQLDGPTLMAAKARVERFTADLDLQARVTRVYACTEEAWCEWKEEDSGNT